VWDFHIHDIQYNRVRLFKNCVLRGIFALKWEVTEVGDH